MIFRRLEKISINTRQIGDDQSEEKRMLNPKLIRKAAILALTSLSLMAPASAALADGGAGNGAIPRSGNAWVIMAGSSLKATLEGWSGAAGWTLIWDSPVDYRMRASASFPGRFEESASKLIDSIYIGNPELSATFHRGNRVLHIQNQPLSSN